MEISLSLYTTKLCHLLLGSSHYISRNLNLLPVEDVN
jgi:hypothetical protein